VVTAVSTTIISFLPVFFLTGRDYKLFAPLALTKTFAIAAALLVAVTLVPALCRLMLRSAGYSQWTAGLASVAGAGVFGGTAWLLWGHYVVSEFAVPLWVVTLAAAAVGAVLGWMLCRERIRPLERSLLSRVILLVYQPMLRLFLRYKVAFAIVPSLLVVFGLGAWFGLPSVLAPLEKVMRKLGAEPNELPGYVDFQHTFTGLESDDWIALDEGSWFYMPTLYPAASFSQAMQVLQTQDVLIGQIPEVQDVLGKIGRVESALDPAPAAMIETYVMLRPPERWREGITAQNIWDEINRVATLPGVTPASPLQPIEGRVVMLQSGIKAPMAIRIYGDELDELADAAMQVADHLKRSPYVDPRTVNPDIVLGKPYVEFTVDRDAASRYGMTAQMVNQIIETALGGTNVVKTVEGRERYPVQLRYPRDLRKHVDQLQRVPVVTHNGAIVPLGELATLETTWGPGAINSENARLVAHVSFATNGRAGDLESVAEIEKGLRQAQTSAPTPPLPHSHSSRSSLPTPLSSLSSSGSSLDLPPGYTLEAVGSFRNQLEANQRLMWLIPLVLLINLLIIYLQFRRLPLTLVVFMGIPVAFAGGMILLAVNGTEMNTAIWIGFIALFGIAIDDGVVIATYLNQVFQRRQPATVDEIRAAVLAAGTRRIRPCLMTTVTTIAALVPILLATGRGADVARAMALPVCGGMAVELITLFVVPVAYSSFREWKLRSSEVAI